MPDECNGANVLCRRFVGMGLRRGGGLSALAERGEVVGMIAFVYYFRVYADGDEWVAKRGAQVLGRFESVVDACDVAEEEAAAHRPSELLYHDTSGQVRVIGHFGILDVNEQPVASSG